MKIFLSALFLIFVTHFAHAGEIYDRVMDSNTIRCGYVQWQPALSIDANTGQLGGIFYDLTQEIGRRLSLKIEWAEETGWSTAIEGISSGRFDAVCSNFWPTPARARLATFSQPVSYSPLYMWVRPDSRLRNENITDLSVLNSPDYTFTYVDGTTPAQIIERDFPKAKTISYPELTPISDKLNGLATGKGDILIVDTITAHDFLQKNPDSLVILNKDMPVAVKANTMLLPGDDPRFVTMINHAIDDILTDGTFDKILKRHKAETLYLPVQKPYLSQ